VLEHFSKLLALQAPSMKALYEREMEVCVSFILFPHNDWEWFAAETLFIYELFYEGKDEVKDGN
jgi:hypothetical protein